MNEVERAIGALIGALRQGLTLPYCHEDWLWTISLVGALFAIFPVLGAVLVALTRKGTGNRYTPMTCSAFLALGAAFCFVLPWLAFRGTARLFEDLGVGAAAPGLSAGTAATLDAKSCLVPDQRAYLGNQQSMYDLLRAHGGHQILFTVLVGLPLAALLFVLLQDRVAVRRGPRWPLLLLWAPFVVMALTTVSMPARVTAQLWLGFAPASLLGILLVVLVGRPRWSVINRSGRSRPEPEPAAAAAPVARHRPQQPAAPAAPVPPAPQRSAPPVPAAREPAPTARMDAATTGPDGTVPASVPAPMQDRFRRVRTLGTGGFGTVWLAVDTALDRTVAVKYAHAPDAEAEQRMRREARALAAVRHPNCVRIYDIISQQDGLALVMEYIEGMSLYDAIRTNGLLADAAAARLWVTMAEALEAAHTEGVLHRDVKPTNILLDRGGMPHLIDFGIARAGNDMTLTAAGMLVGTPEYIAPEIARGAPASAASDAWQLAATVHYALTGRSPRGTATSPTEAMAAAYAQSDLDITSDTAHGRLLRQSLRADPALRPDLASVRDQLAQYLSAGGHRSDEPITTRIVIDEDATRTIP